ncbi:acyltransferase [Escherichia coli]|nr:acyltransferase [Escherichia coli]
MSLLSRFWGEWFKSYGDTDFITGIRAFAILSVILIHSGGAGLRYFGWYGNNLSNLGAMGPCIFFVISGYSVSVSYEKSSCYLSFLKNRILRIAPLYYFWIVVFILLFQGVGYWGERYGASLNFYNLLMHISFLSFADYRVANSILGVEWSLSIEVFWYIFLPAIILVMRSKTSVCIMLITSWLLFTISLIILKSYSSPNNDDVMIAYYWTPFPYFFSFCAGVAAYRVRSWWRFSGLSADIALLLSITLILLYPIMERYSVNKIIDKPVLFSMLTMVIISVGNKDGHILRSLLCNKVSIFIGSISYSLYLSHYVVIFLVGPYLTEFKENSIWHFIIFLLISIIGSVFTYILIERVLTDKIKHFIDSRMK